jgi:RNA polymerase sigma-70 factor (ECF subfamily)
MPSQTPPTEDELVARLRGGDEAAFGELIDRHHASMLRLARVFVADKSAAEEIVQETWLAVIDGLEDFEQRSSLKTWIFGILGNQSKQRARTDARTQAWSSIFDDSMDQELSTMSERFDGSGHWKSPPVAWKFDPEQRALKHKLLEVVQQAIEQLPASQRGVVWLRDVEGLSSGEVCQVFDITAGNQRVLLHRGRTKVRNAVESYQEAL